MMKRQRVRSTTAMERSRIRRWKWLLSTFPVSIWLWLLAHGTTSTTICHAFVATPFRSTTFYASSTKIKADERRFQNIFHNVPLRAGFSPLPNSKVLVPQTLLQMAMSSSSSPSASSDKLESAKQSLSQPLSSVRNGLTAALNKNKIQNDNYEGLSKYHQSILSRMATDRQRFVSGKYPVICQVVETPTLKWLGANANAQLMVNGTTVERSLASYDRFQWLDDEERLALHQTCALVSWELLAVISLPKPAYVSILPGNGPGSTAASWRVLESTSTEWERWKMGTAIQHLFKDELEQEQPTRVFRDRLWVTGFSLTGSAGHVNSIETDTGHIESVNARTAKFLLWPNEVSPVPSKLFTERTKPLLQPQQPLKKQHPGSSSTTSAPPQIHNDLKDALLVSDGFLVPGKDRGGIYVVTQPGNPNTEWTVCLTETRHQDRWFYHRYVHTPWQDKKLGR